MYTFLLASSILHILYFTIAPAPPSNILYRAQYKTGLDFKNIMQGSAGVRIPDRCGAVCTDSVQHLHNFISLLLILLVFFRESITIH